ncbi:response regulator transcription factor [Neobacillus sp. K501]
MSAGERGRVLIVDDEILIRQGIKHYINWESEGFEIAGEASNGKEALELVEAVNPHIIITDIVMPIMDGEELTRIVKEKYPQIEMIVLSSFGEFDYVRSTFQSGVIDYILKPKLDAEALLNVLKRASSRIPALKSRGKQLEAIPSVGQMLNKLISGYEVDDYSLKLTEIFPNPRFCLLGVEMMNRQSEIPPYIKEKMDKGLKKTSYRLYMEKNLILVNGNEFSKLIEFVKELAETEQGIGFVLSNEFDDVSKICQIYKEDLLKLLNYQFYFPDSPLLMNQDLKNQLPKSENFNLDWFTSEMKRKHFDSAFSYLQEHVSVLSKCYKTDVYEFKAFFGNIIFNITVLLSNMEYNVKEFEQARYSYLRSIEDARSAKEAVEQLYRFIEEVKKSIFSFQNQPENANIKKILDYINDHYTEPLTLADVAQHFHFNPSYLSSYLSAHNNEGFIEYLNKVRIEEASRLLMQGSVSISEISSMVGYSDHSYFCKVFKKMKGLSPSQFRRKQSMR